MWHLISNSVLIYALFDYSYWEIFLTLRAERHSIKSLLEGCNASHFDFNPHEEDENEMKEFLSGLRSDYLVGDTSQFDWNVIIL